MPKTTIENLGPTRVKLTIAVSPEELKPSIDHAYTHIAEQVTIPGFRKGKVPPPIIDQRIGRGEVLNHAVSEGLDRIFQEAVAEEGIDTLGRPEADVTTWPEEKDFSGDLIITVETDVRPEVKLPDYSKYTLEVEALSTDKKAVDEELDSLRERFASLVSVDRPISSGDFVQLDLVAKIGDNTIDTANSISYEMGSGQLIDGIDEALDTLTAGETTTFASELLGGDHAGETADIEVTVLSVKERELPEADDDFAQIASQFDTIAELREDLAKEVERKGRLAQAQEARDKLVEKMLEELDLPVPDGVVEAEVHRHLEQEKRLQDDEHRAEVTESTQKSLRTQFVLDALIASLDIQPTQEELSSYLVQSAGQYGMEPAEFIQALSQQNQLGTIANEVSRSKALSVALREVSIKDSKGKKVDLTDFLGEVGSTTPDEHDH
ncbi:trigger factor [Pontimonas salivibrio]|uniref:Trigger factor n=1 Tax=Pontimonas salivibrio TaxID=1159327 RepID=A0A2L2BPX4_9MICO|nr:trigger factor [Pontimonas salivibrio]AVG23723.1 trigger factor [Pontimonas salivibrio]